MNEIENALNELNKTLDKINNGDNLAKTAELTENNIKKIKENPETVEGAIEMSDLEKDDEEEIDDIENVEGQNPNMPDESLEMLDTETEPDDDDDFEGAYKSKPDLATGQVEAGNAGEMVDDAHPQLDSKYMAKYEDQSTLDLSVENLEKAYTQFKAEQLEKLAYDKIKGNFQSRFDTEMVSKTGEIERSNYDAKLEVDTLKKQFTDLLDSLKQEENTIIQKQEEVIAELNIPNGEEIAKMDWNDINALIERFEGA
jgi:hypothetical protein